MKIETGFPSSFLLKKVTGERGAICYFGREGGRLFGGGRLLERGRLFEEIRYVIFSYLVLYNMYVFLFLYLLFSR